MSVADVTLDSLGFAYVSFYIKPYKAHTMMWKTSRKRGGTIMSKAKTLNERMNYHEASEKFPDSYIIMQLDSLASYTGTVLFVCDTEREAMAILAQLDDMDLCGIVEGVNHQRSFGGIEVGG